jgi:hypothetical protein
MTCACKKHKPEVKYAPQYGPRVKIEVIQRSGAIGSAIGATACGAAFAATGVLAWLAPIAAALCGLAGGAIEDAARGAGASASPTEYRDMLRRTQVRLDKFERREGSDKELSDVLRPPGVKSAIMAGALTCGPRARAMLSMMSAPDEIRSLTQDTAEPTRAVNNNNNHTSRRYATLW